MVMLDDMGRETVFAGVVGVARTYTAGDRVRDVHGDCLGRHLETKKKKKKMSIYLIENETKDILVDRRQVSRREYGKRLQVQFGAKSGLIGGVRTRLNVFLGQGRERVA